MIGQPVDHSAVEDYIRSKYDEMVLLIISDTALRSLYKMKVITLDEKKALQEMKEGKRMEHLLDYIIIPSLEVKHGQKYINLLNVMKSSDDSSLQAAASQLMSCMFDK